ncbi:hypothetical protein AWB71_06000 [Caballeronia peredens]|nr:hypothetical protein AWB71_06000 [Caballeronia peredens]
MPSKKSILFLASIPLALALTGCATKATPQQFGGKYYLMGDAACKQARQLTDTTIMCMRSNGEDTSYRIALTTQEVWMYERGPTKPEYSSSSIQMSDLQALSNQLQGMSASFNAQAQNTLRQSSQYVAPQVAPIQQPNSGDIRCIQAGIYVNCRSN